MWLFVLANPWRAGFIVLLFTLVGAYVQISVHKASADRAKRELAEAHRLWAEDNAKAIQHAREIERRAAARIAEIDAQHQSELAAARDSAARVVADLRAGNLRLREHWAGCEARRVPGTAASAAQPDEAAELRRESASRIVRAADECDAHVRGLQRVVEAR